MHKDGDEYRPYIGRAVTQEDASAFAHGALAMIKEYEQVCIKGRDNRCYYLTREESNDQTNTE